MYTALPFQHLHYFKTHRRILISLLLSLLRLLLTHDKMTRCKCSVQFWTTPLTGKWVIVLLQSFVVCDLVMTLTGRLTGRRISVIISQRLTLLSPQFITTTRPSLSITNTIYPRFVYLFTWFSFNSTEDVLSLFEITRSRSVFRNALLSHQQHYSKPQRWLPGFSRLFLQLVI